MHCVIISEQVNIDTKGYEVFEISKGEHKTIGVDSLKGLKNFVYTRARQRLVLIKQAHLMNEFVQNKLLKMLEEPPFGVSFFLLTDEPEHLLPTVRSRSIVIKDAERFLNNMGLSVSVLGVDGSAIQNTQTMECHTKPHLEKLVQSIIKKDASELFKVKAQTFKEELPFLMRALQAVYMYQECHNYDFLHKIINKLDEINTNLHEGSNLELECDRFFIYVLEA